MKTTTLFIVLFFISYFINSQNSHFIEFDNNTIHYKIFENKNSDKPVIFIINGGPGMNSNGFDSLAKQLKSNNTIITYDQRGTGKSMISEINSKTLTLDLMIEDIEAIRKDIGVKDWVVLGHSFGGMLASYYATKFPRSIKALIFSSSGGIDTELFSSIDINSKLTKTQRDSVSYWSNKIRLGDTTYNAKYQRGKHLANAYLQNKGHIKTIAHRLTQVNFHVNELVFQNINAINFDCSNKLKTFSKPVLIVQGKQDIIPVKISEKAHQIIPNSRLVLLDNCAHYGWLDKPKKYFNTISDFLSLVSRIP